MEWFEARVPTDKKNVLLASSFSMCRRFSVMAYYNYSMMNAYCSEFIAILGTYEPL